MLKCLGMLGQKILGCFVAIVLTDRSQNLVITVSESCHAQPCDHGLSNYPQLNVRLFDPHAAQ